MDLPPVVAPPGGCAPDTLVRLVVRNVSPGLAAADPRAQPRLMYRRSSIYMRTEEPPDPSHNGAKMLFIVSEPDIWIVDASTRSGRHSRDAGPQFEVHAPILPNLADLPPAFQALEFGCEAAFVAANAPEVRRTLAWGETTAALHALTAGDQTVALLMDERRGAPLMVSYLRKGKPVWVVRYDEFRADLPEHPELFQPSKSTRIQEAPPPGAPPLITPQAPRPETPLRQPR